MLYELYENKMKKIAKVKNGILRFKALILSVIGICMAGLVAFLSTKGMITEEVELSLNEITYGEKLEYKADAFCSSVKYEFSEDGKTWSKEEPIYPGNYYIRAVSKRSFGIKGHSDAVEFAIQPKEIDLSITKEVPYGDNPQLLADLPYGDRIADGYDISYDYKAIRVAMAKVDTSSIHIINSYGEDVTSAYVFPQEYESEFKIINRKITLKALDMKTTYDGLEHRYEEYEMEGSLVGDQNIEVEFDSVAVNAGATANQISSARIYEDGVDVTENYDIEYVDGEIFIEQAELDIETLSNTEEFIYNGHVQSNPEYNSGELVQPTHRIELIDYAKPIYVGTYENTMTFKIYDTLGTEEINDDIDVTNNYHMNISNGSIRISAAPIKIITGSSHKVYDGIHFIFNDFEVTEGEISSEDVLQVVSDSLSGTRRINVGIYSNDIRFKIFSSAGTDITNNYTIEYEYGSLQIYPKVLLFSPIDVEAIYGDRIEYQYSLADGIVYRDKDLESQLKVGYKIAEIEDTEELPVGKYEYSITGVEIDDEQFNNNYEFSFNGSTATVTITKRPLTLRYSLPIDAIYKGEEYTNFEKIIENNLPTHSVNFNMEVDHGPMIDAGTYMISISDIHILNSKEEEVNDNYEIITNPQSFTIGKFPLRYTILSVEKEYNGEIQQVTKEDLIGKTISLNSQPLPTNHEFRCDKIIGSGKDCKEYDISIVGLAIYNEDKDVTYNFNINIIYNKLKITPIKLTLKSTGSTTAVYDGQSHFNNEYVLDREVLDNEQIEIKSQKEVINVSDSGKNIMEFRIFDKTTLEDVTGNYTIDTSSTAYGNINVTPRPLTISIKNSVQTYNGKTFSQQDLFGNFDTFTIDSGELVDSHILQVPITIQNNSKNVGTYIIKENGYTINGGNVDKANYAITVKEGKLTINKASVGIRIDDIVREYTTSPMMYVLQFLNWLEKCHKEYGELYEKIKGISLSAPSCPTTNDVGEYDLIINRITLNDDLSIDKNYDVTYICGKLIITPLSIILVANNAQQIYKGSSYTDFNDIYEKLESGYTLKSSLLQGHSIQSLTLEEEERIYVGTYPLLFHSTVIVDSSGRDVTKNYDIFYQAGTLSIGQQVLEIQVEDTDKVYDGTPLIANDVSVSGLLAMDSLTGEYSGSQTDVGRSESSYINIKVENKDTKKDVTDQYQIFVQNGILLVTKREITLIAPSQTKVFDNEILTYKNTDPSSIEITGNELAPDQKLESIDFDGEIRLVGKQYNQIRNAVIYDKTDKDVTKNYSITYEMGILEVIPFELNFNTKSQTWEYDSKTHYYLEYDVEGSTVFEGHQIKVMDYTTITNVGTIINKLRLAIYENEDDITYCYTIQFESEGTLEITSKELHIKGKSLTKEYDGKLLTPQDVGVEVEGLIEGQMIGSIQYDNIQLKNVGSVDFRVSNARIVLVSDRNTDVTNNYNITYEDGHLEITSRQITIALESKEIIYDNKTYTIWSDLFEELTSAYRILSGSLAEQQEINNIIYLNLNATNAGSYDLIVESISIVDKDEENTEKNYDITYENGKFVISPREVTISIEMPSDQVYKGDVYTLEEIYNGEDSYTVSNLAEGHVLESLDLKFYQEGIEIGEVKNAGTYVISGDNPILNIDSELVEQNYRIEILSTTFTILPREISVKPNDIEVNIRDVYPNGVTAEYEGYDAWTQTDGELCSGHTIVDVVIIGELKIVGTATRNIQSLKIMAETEDVTLNYNITYETGNITITPIVFTIKTASAEKDYDSMPLTCPEWNISYEGEEMEKEDLEEKVLLPNHTIEVDVYGSVTTVKDCLEEHNNYFMYRILEDGVDVTSKYYDVTNEAGHLQINQVIIQIGFSASKYSKPYDTNPVIISEEDFYFIDGDGERHIKQYSVIPGERLALQEVQILRNGMELKDKLHFNNFSSYEDMFSAGEYTINIQTLRVWNSNLGQSSIISVNDVQSTDYIIEVVEEENTFYIDYAELRLELASKPKKTYDGRQIIYTASDISYEFVTENISDTHFLGYKLGYSNNILELESGIRDAGTYIMYVGQIRLSDARFSDFTLDFDSSGNCIKTSDKGADNYHISADTVINEIEKRKITVKTESAIARVYETGSITASGYEVFGLEDCYYDNGTSNEADDKLLDLKFKTTGELSIIGKDNKKYQTELKNKGNVSTPNTFEFESVKSGDTILDSTKYGKEFYEKNFEVTSELGTLTLTTQRIS